MIATLYPGGITDKLKLFFETPAGEELALYYAGIEVALPFTDNLIEASGNWMGKLLDSTGSDDSRFKEFAGSIPFEQARSILEGLKTHIDSTLVRVKPYLDPLRDKLANIAPTMMNIADSTTGAIATAFDIMPFWSFLGARLVAEAAAIRAVKGV